MFGIYFMPVWAYTLASHIEDIPGLQVFLFDERVDRRSDLPHADLYLFTGINQDAEAIFALRDYVRATHPKSTICLGGPITWSYLTADKLHTITGFDHVFIGDGEEALPQFIRATLNNESCDTVIRTEARFDLGNARRMSRTLLESTYHRYYGGVIEVSRGCPFLCEFCDIRILPDNNRPHIKHPDLIVEELHTMATLGITQVLFACDNFIGNLAWAEEVCDRIILWTERTGLRVSLYTWLTINLSKSPRLMMKLRKAGFDMCFIGVESFHQSSLLETAKVQNTHGQLTEALRDIQSYGLIVVAGLIFGFDSDPDDVADVTLRGMLESGLISGDPSLLMALPGTPLYERMKASGRLRDMKFSLGGFKYQTNIKYLKPADRIQQDFLGFVKTFTSGQYQYERLLAFYSCINSAHYVPSRTSGYADLPRLLVMTFRNVAHVRSLVVRLARLFLSFQRIRFILKAVVFTVREDSTHRPLWCYFKFWLFSWSNALVKYSGLSEKDFNIDWVGRNFDIARVLPANYDDAKERIPIDKIRKQRHITTVALKDLIARYPKAT